MMKVIMMNMEALLNLWALIISGDMISGIEVYTRIYWVVFLSLGFKILK